MSVLSNFVTSGLSTNYLEYAWLTTTQVAAQDIGRDSLWQICTLDTEIADTGNYGSISSNQITLAAGTYYYDIMIPIYTTSGRANINSGIYSNTDSKWLGLGGFMNSNSSDGSGHRNLGQFVISAQKVLTLRVRCANAGSGNGLIKYANDLKAGFVQDTTFTQSDFEQRTTLKLWKLK